MSLIRKHGAVLQAWACLALVKKCHGHSPFCRHCHYNRLDVLPAVGPRIWKVLSVRAGGYSDVCICRSRCLHVAVDSKHISL